MKNLLLLLLVTITITTSAQNDDDLYLVGNSFLYSINFDQNCFYTPIINPIDDENYMGFNPGGIAFTPNGKLYMVDGEYLYEIKIATEEFIFIGEIPDDRVSGITSNSEGVLYMTGMKLTTYTPDFDLFSVIGDLPVESSGDIVLHHDQAFYTGDDKIYQLNLENPINSEVYLEFSDTFPNIIDIFTHTTSCTESKTYLLTGKVEGENFTQIYELDFSDNSLNLICDRFLSNVKGGSSPLDWLTSQECELLVDLDFNNNNTTAFAPFAFQIDTFCTKSLPITDQDVEIYATTPIDTIEIWIADSPQNPQEERLIINNPLDYNVTIFQGERNLIRLVATANTTFEDYEAVLRNTRYEITGANIIGGQRTINVVAHVNGIISEAATALLTITTNEPPAAGADRHYGICEGSSLILKDEWSRNLFAEGRFTPPLDTNNNGFYVIPTDLAGSTFLYTTAGTNGCLGDTAIITTEGLPLPQTGLPIDGVEVHQYCIGTTPPEIQTQIDTSFVESFRWNDGFPELNRVLNARDWFSIDVYAPNGCQNSYGYILGDIDTIRIVEAVYLCEGETYTYNGTTFTQDTFFVVETLPSTVACDTNVILSLNFSPHIEETIDATLCQGESYTIGNQSFSESGSYNLNLVNEAGCDTSIILNLQVVPQTELTVALSSIDCTTPTRTLTAMGTWENITWSTGEQTNSIEVNSSGTYSVTVSNNGSCSRTESIMVDIVDASNLEVDAQITPNICPNGNDGLLILTANGTQAPYTYEWSDGETGNFRANLPAGLYTATISDANGCQLIFQDSITTPSNFSVTGGITNASTQGSMDGAILIENIVGGTPPYILNWSNGATGYQLDNLPVGNYTLTVQDANNCQYRTGFLISFNVAVEDNLKKELAVLIQPNPTKNFRAVIQSTERIKQLSLYDLQGQLVKIFPNQSKQLEAPSAGLFLVKIQLKNQQVIWRRWVVL